MVVQTIIFLGKGTQKSCKFSYIISTSKHCLLIWSSIPSIFVPIGRGKFPALKENCIFSVPGRKRDIYTLNYYRSKASKGSNNAFSCDSSTKRTTVYKGQTA